MVLLEIVVAARLCNIAKLYLPTNVRPLPEFCITKVERSPRSSWNFNGIIWTILGMVMDVPAGMKLNKSVKTKSATNLFLGYKLYVKLWSVEHVIIFLRGKKPRRNRWKPFIRASCLQPHLGATRQSHGFFCAKIRSHLTDGRGLSVGSLPDGKLAVNLEQIGLLLPFCILLTISFFALMLQKALKKRSTHHPLRTTLCVSHLFFVFCMINYLLAFRHVLLLHMIFSMEF